MTNSTMKAYPQIIIMEKPITNREFLREYKKWKEKLMKGEVEEIEVKQDDDVTLCIRLKKKRTPFEIFLEEVKKRPLKGLKRPEEDIF